MRTCGHTWNASYHHPDGRTTLVRQVCTEPTGHDGDHRSWSKVTTPNPQRSERA